MFFKALNTNSEDYAPYYRTLVKDIRSAASRAQEVAGDDKTVTAQLVHTIRFGKDVVSTGEVRYNTSVFKNNQVVSSDTFTQPLVEGENYNFGPLQEFIEEAVQNANQQIDSSVLMGYPLETDDIVDLVVTYVLNYLENRKVFNGFNVSVTCMYGNINSVTVTVA